MKKIALILFFLPILFSCNHSKDSNKEINEQEAKNNSEKADSLKKPAENPYKDAQIDIKVFKNDTIPGSPLKGFGYDIFMFNGNSPYVHQPHIPAISGNRGFNTEEQAHKAAELIVYKIKNNIMPPSVTPRELDSLGVLK